MANFIISFNCDDCKDFGQFCGVFGTTVAGELGYFDVATEADADFDKRTITCNGISEQQSTEIFSALIVELIGEHPSFELLGSIDAHIQFSAKYNNDELSVQKTVNEICSSEVYQLEDGSFNDEDGDEFAFFFDL